MSTVCLAAVLVVALGLAVVAAFALTLLHRERMEHRLPQIRRKGRL